MLRRLFGKRGVDERVAKVAGESSPDTYWQAGAAAKTDAGQALLDGTPEEQLEAVMACFAVPRDADHRERRIANDLAATLLRRKLPFTEAHFATLLDAMLAERDLSAYSRPVAQFLGALERWSGGTAPPALHERLARLNAVFARGQTAEYRKLAQRIALLRGAASVEHGLAPSDDPWTRALLAHEDPLAAQVLPVAAKATGAKPTKAFRAAGEHLPAHAGETATALLATAVAAKGDTQVPTDIGDVLRGLVWLADGEHAPRTLGDVALAGWKKVPGYGPLCRKAADAAITVLAGRADGAPQLGRLRAQLKQPAAVRSVDAAIDAAAERLGIPRADFEERVVPRIGARSVPVGDYTVELSADGGLAYVNAAGKPLKSAPAAIKEEVKALKLDAKELAVMHAAQKARLERLLQHDRTWTYATWREHYADHPLVSDLADRLIWTIDGRATLGAEAEPGEEVRLWHPVDAPPEEVRAWRRTLEERELTQPFKQAHREVYLLTAAEERTGVYSNRFAAHVLRQHQMAALARGRGWTYALQGAWDTNDEVANLELPGGLRVEFWVDRPWDTEDWNDTGVFNHVLSDQVRFTNGGGDGVRLDAIPPRVFSEAMRDVDLFVGVTSIGNDPNWGDSGGERRYVTYWQGYAFGELGESAQVRRDLLERLLPKLAIRDVATLDGRFLRVQGTHRAYKIHLGSTNILMEPNDQYLCIVPGRGKDAASTVYLPFEGDQGLALILSKAFLLAKDDKITDQTIVSQIRRR